MAKLPKVSWPVVAGVAVAFGAVASLASAGGSVTPGVHKGARPARRARWGHGRRRGALPRRRRWLAPVRARPRARLRLPRRGPVPERARRTLGGAIAPRRGRAVHFDGIPPRARRGGSAPRARLEGTRLLRHWGPGAWKPERAARSTGSEPRRGPCARPSATMVDTSAVVRARLAGGLPHLADRDRGGGSRRGRCRDRDVDRPRAGLARDLSRVRDLGHGVSVGQRSCDLHPPTDQQVHFVGETATALVAGRGWSGVPGGGRSRGRRVVGSPSVSSRARR